MPPFPLTGLLATLLVSAPVAPPSAPASTSVASPLVQARPMMVCGQAQSRSEPFDIAAREAQVASGDQRIAPLAPEDFTKEAQQIADSLRSFFKFREQGLPKAIATMAQHPGLYRGQIQLGLELNQRGKLPPREREMIILRTAWLVRSPFEWGEHVAYGKRLGLTTKDVERITQGSAAPGWSEHDRAVLRGVEELMCDYAVSDGTWQTLSKSWTEPQLMELPGLVGSYTLTAMLYNSMKFGLVNGNDGFSAR